MGRTLSAADELFYREAIQRENEQRLGWFVKHGKHLLNEYQQQVLEDIQKAKSDEDPVKVPGSQPPKFVVEKKEIQGKPEVILDTMKPVPEDVRKLIYIGYSQIGEGREKYLKTRNILAPRDKYYYTDVTSWNHGWMVTNEDLLKETRRGQTGVIEQSFYRRNGVGPDPDYYRQPVNTKAPFPLPLLD